MYNSENLETPNQDWTTNLDDEENRELNMHESEMHATDLNLHDAADTHMNNDINVTHATSSLDIPMVMLDSMEDVSLGQNFVLRQIQLPDYQAGITNASITFD